jgi:uracil permease
MYTVNENPPAVKAVFYGLQHLLACFGATVLVPLLIGLDPARAIFSAGIGTLAYRVVTQFKVPNFFGSSFAIIAVGAIALKQGEHYLAVGALSSALTYGVVSLAVRKLGQGWIKKVLPPVVIGPVVAIIGLSLAAVAVTQAFKGSGGAFSVEALVIAAVTLAIIVVAMYSKNRFISSISVLLGLVGGYLITVALGAWVHTGGLDFRQFVSFQGVVDSLKRPLAPPHFVVFWHNLNAHTAIVVAASFVITSFATICEHIGHTIVTGEIVEKDLVADPGLHRTILGDGIATAFAGVFGSVCNTTYGESLGVMATTKVYSVSVFVYAAAIALVLSIVTPFSALIQSFPLPVLGGACILLFGTIASNGLKQLVVNKVDLDSKRNLTICSVTFIVGIGGAAIPLIYNGETLDLLSSIALAAIVGIVLNLALPQEKGAPAR